MGAKSRADVTPEIRGGLLRALKIMKESGRPISTIWIELFNDDPATAMRLAISTMPKEVQADVTTRTIEDFVVSTVAIQAIDDSTEEAQLH